jgi:hypothetical protein
MMDISSGLDHVHHRDAVASHLPGYFREEGMQRRHFQFGSRRAGPPACDKNGGKFYEAGGFHFFGR